MKKIFVLSIIILVLSFSLIARAGKPTGISDDFPALMRGVRPLGMGNAFTAMPGTDAIAQFYNPAAINDYDDSGIIYSIGMPMIEYGDNFWGIIKDLFQLRDDLKGSASSSQKIDIFSAFTQSHLGEFNTFNTAMPMFHVRTKNYAGGLVVDSRFVISLRNQAFPNFDFKTSTSTGGIFGSAYSFFDDALQVGANLKVLYRMGLEQQVTTTDILVSNIKDLVGFGAWQKGIGAGVDVGSKYKLPILEDALAPTLSFTVQDIGNTRFTGDAPELPMSVTVGGGIFPEIGFVKLAVLADFRELNRGMAFLNKFHFGVEAKFPEVIKTNFSLRAGCNQGYPAAGLSAEWAPVTLNFAFYAEEAGMYDHSKATYRYATGLSFDF